jgi:hypothetical protein
MIKKYSRKTMRFDFSKNIWVSKKESYFIDSENPTLPVFTKWSDVFEKGFVTKSILKERKKWIEGVKCKAIFYSFRLKKRYELYLESDFHKG